MRTVLELVRRLNRTVGSHRAILAMANRESWHPEAGTRKSALHRYLDLLYLSIRWDERSSLYFAQGIDLKGRSVRRDYLAYERFRHLRDARNRRPLPSASVQYTCLLQDKLLFERFFGGGGLPVARSVGSLDPGLRCDLGALGRGDLYAMAADGLAEVELFCKPRFGIKGGGAFRLRVAGGQMYVNGRPATRTELEGLVQVPYLCQHPIQQHEAVARLHPQSLNTVRVITFREDDRIEVFLTYLRIGGNGQITDNNPHARAVVRIDDAGELHAEGYWLQGDDARRTPVHRTTGAAFAGIRIPYFDACRDVAASAHRWLPGVHSVGWDVALTAHGVLLLEGNDDWGSKTVMRLLPEFSSRFLKRVQ